MRKILPIAIILILLILGGLFYWKYMFTYSDGNRTGLLQKFSRRGNMFKTYEGELVLSSVVGNNSTSFSSEKFFFSVDDEAVAKKLMNFEGQRVTLHYQEKKGTLFWRGDTNYIVDSIRAAGQ
jgi:hypothetical protein